MLTNATHRAGVLWRAHREATRLRRSDDPDAHRLSEALAAAFDGKLEEADAACLRAVEALRATLLAANDAVTFRDYGVPARWHSASAPDTAFRETTRTVRDICRSSVPPYEGRLLYHLVRHFRPVQCLELGTCLGLSAAYTAAALNRNGTGRLVTLEGGAALARLAEAHLRQLHLHHVDVVSGRFADTLPDVLAAHHPIDFAFIDGHHNPAALHTYYHQLTPYLADRAVLVFDDIFWTTGMRTAWSALAADERIRTRADLLALGICIYDVRTAP